MPTISLYNIQGQTTGQRQLDEAVFNVAVKPAVIHQVVNAIVANSRQVLSDVKTKAEVSGGGRKPWKQKGTGRARQGSIRSPQWRGGGMAHGPKGERNYEQKINKKMKKQAVRMVLSDKCADGAMIVMETLSLSEAKTKQMVSLLNSLPLAGKSTLIVTAKPDSMIQRSAANLQKVSVTTASNLNVYDLLKYKRLLVVQEALPIIEKHYH
ncbi:MAG: 50S ribosomal protein L4 [bacterium]